MVVSILLFVASVAVRDLVHSVRVSEENKVRAATTEYSALRNVYAEQYHVAPASLFSVNSTNAASVFSTPVH
jgi:hypothetical protein